MCLLFNLHKFVLFSRIKAKNGSFAKKGPYKGRNQRIYCDTFRKRTEAARKNSKTECMIQSPSVRNLLTFPRVLLIHVSFGLFTLVNRYLLLNYTRLPCRGNSSTITVVCMVPPIVDVVLHYCKDTVSRKPNTATKNLSESSPVGRNSPRVDEGV